MRIRTKFPHQVTVIEHTWIPLSDGCRLAARIWLPENAEFEPVPALLEYLPYRKNDETAHRDSMRQSYFAGFGYAAVRVDMRGSGDSDGLLLDEYLKIEQDDGLEILKWIASQPWCDGNIGMHGISWGGFNSLQIAARNPPELKAIMAIGFSDDRYNDDVHYMGGCLLTRQMLAWSCEMFICNALPPDPRIVPDSWRETWMLRLKDNRPFLEKWIQHQLKDDYWKHGSISEDYSAIKVPVYAVGGWADSYNNSIPRLLSHLKTPHKALIGPWAHGFPESRKPGPQIGFLQESVRWWDYWLKGKETGIMEEPLVRFWIQDGLLPNRHYTKRPGRWFADSSWPSRKIDTLGFYLNSKGSVGFLSSEPERTRSVHIKGVQAHTLDCGDWGMAGHPGDFPGDQRSADGEALSFTSHELESDLVLLGRPLLELKLKSDQPRALIAARLCEVFPTGASSLISYGILNLNLRNSQEIPELLEPGESYSVQLELNLCGHKVHAGNRLRISLSPTFLRYAWPSPQPATLSFLCGKNCRLSLPIVKESLESATEVKFPTPETAQPISIETIRKEKSNKSIRTELVSGRSTLQIDTDAGRYRYPCGLEIDSKISGTLGVDKDEPLSAEYQIDRLLQYQRDDWQITLQTSSKLWADESHFFASNTLLASEGEEKVFEKTWQFKTKRLT